MNFEVNRNDFRETRVVNPDRFEPGPGHVRLTVERFAFTANNISYALSGDMLDYWGFFPAESPWGRIPVMGFGTVVDSAAAEIAVGGRYFGFFPMADELMVEARSSRGGFSDVAGHRAGHADAYTSFLDVAHDPLFREDRADEYLLLRGLFMTSFLVDDFLGDADFFGATQTLVTSASSKTSIALASCLAARGHRSVGLTSGGNRSFVQGLDLYDEVRTYDEIGGLDAAVPSVVVDMAGNADVRSTIHHHFGEALRHSSQVGATHWEETGGSGDPLPGPAPEFFFAPAQMAKRAKDWGPGEMMNRIGAALADFLEGAPAWLTVQRSYGADGMETVYRELLEGHADPSIGHILSAGRRP